MKKYSMLVICVILIMTGCTRHTEPKTVEAVRDNKLEIWSYYDGWQEEVNEFKAKYGKDIEVEVKVFSNKEYVDAYLEGMASKDGPDLVIMDSLQMGQFNTLDAFENLLDEPYDIGKYKKDFDKSGWTAGMDFKQEKMIAVMVASAPKVTFYRADIMKEHRFPDDPMELATFLEDPNNYLAVAESLIEDGVYITQWALDPLTILMSAMPYFDQDYNFIMTSEAFSEGIELCRTFKEKGLLSYKDVWLEEGQDLIKKNQHAMLYFGTWGSSQIENWVPEQKGLWRVTSLPFGTHAISNGTLMAIPSNSNNKELAWEFIEQYVFGDLMPIVAGSIPCYIPKQAAFCEASGANEFLGGQNEQQFYTDILKKCKHIPMTSLDEDALRIINEQIIKGIDGNYANENIIQNINKEIEKQLGEKREILRK